MNSTNIRVGVVFVAEAVHRATGKDVLTVYRLIDTCALFAGLLAMLAFLFATVPPSYAVVGAAGFASVLPLTYQLFYFHPWDRVSLVGWLLLLLFLKRGRLLAFTALLPIVMLVKWDVVLLPGLVFLCNAPWPLRRNALVRTSAITAGLFCLTFGIYWMLQMLRPGGFEPVPSAWELVVKNWELFRSMKWGYPPLLGFTVIGVLAIIGFRWTDRFGRACAVFAAGIMFVFVIGSNFAEFRAEVPVVILLLPVALDGLRGLLEGRKQLPSSAA